MLDTLLTNPPERRLNHTLEDFSYILELVLLDRRDIDAVLRQHRTQHGADDQVPAEIKQGILNMAPEMKARVEEKLLALKQKREEIRDKTARWVKGEE